MLRPRSPSDRDDAGTLGHLGWQFGGAMWDDPSAIAVVTCYVCFAISAYFVPRYMQEKPQLITIMALFALVWAINVVYWLTNEPITSAVLGICTSFVTIYIGVLLVTLRDGLRKWQHW